VVSFLKERSVPAVFWAILICLALHVFFWVTPPAVVAAPGDGLLYYLLQPLSKLPGIALIVLYFTIVIVQALRINNMLNSNRMFQKATFTAALAYILLTALWPPCNHISPALLVNSLVIWLLFRIVKLYSVKQSKALLYNIGLISGCTVLLYYPALGIVPFVFIALGITRAFRLNEWLVLLLGLITPFYFWGCYLFLTDQLASVKTLTTLFYLHGINGAIKPMAIAFSGAGLLLLVGIIQWQSHRILLIQVRKTWAILLLMLILLVPSVFVFKTAWPFALLLGCVPASALAANAFFYPKGILSPLLFWLIAAVIVYVNWLALQK